jgi:MHS family proline/betaine transporter-like MFS transporter
MRIKSIISSSIGNSLEWYDFGLFQILAPTLSKLFFPKSDPHTQLILTFGLFAAGYLCRPLGGLLFGYLGDKRGRASTLRLSVLMIALPTLLIGLLPTYNTIGIGAPILLMLIRIWQGFCIGGECGGNVIYLAELAPIYRRATVTSLVSLGANIGYLLALVVGTICFYLFTEASLVSWGWRVPYLASGVLCLIIYTTRLHLQETAAFDSMKKENRIVSNPIHLVLRHNITALFRVSGIFTMGIVFFYSCFIFMPTLLTQKLGYPAIEANNLMIVMTIIMTILSPLAGILCDKIGRRNLLLLVALLITVFVFPCFYLLSFHAAPAFVFSILLIFTIIASLEQGASYVAAAENFPLPARYTGLSLSYNVGAAIFGGTTPLICEWLIGKMHSLIAPVIYIIACTLITAMIALFFMEEKHGESLAV